MDFCLDFVVVEVFVAVVLVISSSPIRASLVVSPCVWDLSYSGSLTKNSTKQSYSSYCWSFLFLFYACYSYYYYSLAI